MMCSAVHPPLHQGVTYVVFIMTQALAGLVVARSHIHLACAGGEAVLRWGAHDGGGSTKDTESQSKVAVPLFKYGAKQSFDLNRRQQRRKPFEAY